MRTPILCGGLVLAVLLASASPVVAQTVVRGTVVDANNQPIEGATVNFEAVQFVDKREVQTDTKGAFIIQGLPSGEYKVTASKEGVGTETQTAEVTQQFKAELSFQLVPEALAARIARTAGAGRPPALEALAAGATVPKEQAEETAAIQAIASAAMDAYRAEQYQESAARLSELVAKLPTCGDCFIYLGNSYSQLKQFDQAEAALKQSVTVEPTVEGYTALTRLYNTQRRFDLAGDASQKASDLAAAPQPPGTAAAASADGTAAAAPAPSASSETLFNQGVVFWNSGKYAEAKTQFEAAVKANPENAAAQYQLGMANLNLGQIPAARAAFEAYLKAAPNGDQAAQVKTFLQQLPK